MRQPVKKPYIRWTNLLGKDFSGLIQVSYLHNWISLNLRFYVSVKPLDFVSLSFFYYRQTVLEKASK